MKRLFCCAAVLAGLLIVTGCAGGPLDGGWGYGPTDYGWSDCGTVCCPADGCSTVCCPQTTTCATGCSE